ncbi:blr3110 [Bradyrhizobium diazoefficiens USDA 110]|uniref:Blr3110 protein n=1 Tax=Bradyrhizobium diazoefficiens (strain JCM 10833 / BCRC 13528 / IAM 13628 / NBRC 14792 / USDA 110) TaxID=224911 RepID=Q89QL4_BRADU|nr:hypothetical protein [Bradyrhizobium diazoefficiens]AND88553.1 hypothetical protein AAV28_12570 [Bradyrhizobium diazoefficiens USDA 110]PDT63245.1 hypothetical protein CO678_02330 [Bradyrhizobium diazoefficiens]QBP21923.1 hypothetical protein Bdiaspc4_16075 [Bradyrhizobium diazoefficiens]QLD45087.1 hypothetical protein HUW42_30750 [Bradyrhizobium diazoefficiens]WLA71429.1 hypothetical protein QIH77_31705 [Bradyrhizobium diazoefficiens]
MSEQVVHSEVQPFSARAALPWLVSLGVYATVLILGQRLLNDPDSYSHIEVGRWIMAHGALPASDPFSFSMHGAPWITFEWLSEMVYAGVYALSGWPGVVVVAAAAIALAFGLLTFFLLRELSPSLTLLMVIAAVILSAPHMLARPHVLVLPVMVTWAAALVRCMDRGGAPPYWALPLLVLWANLHGSVVLALGLIGPAVLEALLREGRSGWSHVLLRWLPFAALALAASCLTPYGPEPLLMPLTTLGLGPALAWISEWRPQDFSRIGGFELLLLAGIFALSRGVTLPLVRALVVIGLLHFALAQIRNADLLAMLAPLYLAAPLGRKFGGPTGDDAAGSSRGLTLAAFAGLIAVSAAALAHDIRPAPIITPQAAIAQADLAKAGPVLNDYSFGGYLIFAGIPTFIDGRGELYGGPFIDRYNRAVALVDLGDFLKLLDEYKIGATLLAPRTPAVAMLDRLPQWQRVYSDDVAVVHKRRDAPLR